MAISKSQKALIISLSGPSSSGKTTLARLLRDLLPNNNNTFILHQDDFYHPESHLPLRAGHKDWDCPASLDLPALTKALQHIKSTEFIPILSQIDIKLFLLASESAAIARRKARDGYVTLEGFWKDPEGYVEEVVWPNYVEQHSYLFEGGM
ncbi:P-loop containing nucleoside triphosphate hydrolase protein [Apiosordaria backusii]|uniref:P-loop containing nucleoside triphosphate hydrolase protein n=1 Tax=Apiosordaria backusii TaxID=314023 RepID=A0AA40ELZ8_9PEZI|nr:P-loop containing nucleoside triphosphate hydrolase protein [Apiosordaria backusii]